MAQTTHGLLAESTSIEYVPRLAPPKPRNPSFSSTLSIDSASNFFPLGEPAAEGAHSTSLPSFYPSGARDATPSNPDQNERNWPDILFHGWRVVLISCTPFLRYPFLPSNRASRAQCFSRPDTTIRTFHAHFGVDRGINLRI